MERKGRSAAEVCTSQARKIGETPCAGAIRAAPVREMCLALSCFFTVEVQPLVDIVKRILRGAHLAVGRLIGPRSFRPLWH
jgi:hypothetical protein